MNLTASSVRGEGFGHTPTVPRGSATPTSQLENDHLTSTFLFYLITWVHFFTGYWGQNELKFTYLGFFCFYKLLLTNNYSKKFKQIYIIFTGKSFSEALILASVNPQYDKRLFIEFPEKYKFTTHCVQILF